MLRSTALINNFSLYLALRYLRPKRTFVSVITVISVLGVSLGVAVLIVVIAVMAGFHDQIKKLAMGYESHVEAADRYGSSMWPSKERPPDVQEKSWREVLKAIRQTPGVVSATPIVRGLLLIEGPNNNMAPALMWGLNQEDGDRLTQKHAKLLVDPPNGKIDLKSDDQGDKIVIDEAVARAWDIRLGDEVTVFAPSNLRDLAKMAHELDDKEGDDKKEAEKKMKEMVASEKMRVSGIFSPPRLQDSDKLAVVILPLHIAQEFAGLEDGVTSIGIEVENPYQAGEVKEELKKTALPETWAAATWMEQHQQLFDTVQNELEMMYFVLFIIVIVAAFCVMNTMITVTVQKRREIGIISALGSRIGQIMWVFLTQGMIVGVFGALSGLGLGLLVVFFRNDIRRIIAELTGREIFAQAIYGLAEIPAKVVPHDVGIICIGAFGLCTVAALVPAWLAGRTEPAVALRD
jgi:lipoprotein-releasing system permease protein